MVSMTDGWVYNGLQTSFQLGDSTQGIGKLDCLFETCSSRYGRSPWRKRPRSKVRASMVPLRILAMFRPRKIFPRRRGAAVGGERRLCIYTICNTCCICHVRMCSNNDSTSNARTHTQICIIMNMYLYIYTCSYIYNYICVYICIYIMYVCLHAYKIADVCVFFPDVLHNVCTYIYMSYLYRCTNKDQLFWLGYKCLNHQPLCQSQGEKIVMAGGIISELLTTISPL